MPSILQRCLLMGVGFIQMHRENTTKMHLFPPGLGAKQALLERRKSLQCKPVTKTCEY